MREQARRTVDTCLPDETSYTNASYTEVGLDCLSFSRALLLLSLLLLLLLLLLLSVFSLFVSTIYSSRRRSFASHVFLMRSCTPLLPPPVPLCEYALRAVRTPAARRKTKKKETRRHVLAKRFVPRKRSSDFAYKGTKIEEKTRRRRTRRRRTTTTTGRRRQSRWKIQNRCSRAVALHSGDISTASSQKHGPSYLPHAFQRRRNDNHSSSSSSSFLDRVTSRPT